MQYLDQMIGKNFISTVLISSLMLLIFVADLQATTEIYIGGLYVVVIMLSLWLPNSKYTIFFSLASSFLACFGYFFSIYITDISNYLSTDNFINLGMTISAIWITALIAIYIRNVSREIKRSEIIHREILNASIDPIIIVNIDGVITSASKAIERAFGWSAQEIIGQRFEHLLGATYRDKYASLFSSSTNFIDSQLLGNVREVIGRHRLKREFPCELSVNYITSADLEEPFFTAVLRDITVRKGAEQKMDWLLFHDELTSIYNRRYFNEQIEKEWKRLLRNQEFLGIIIIDVDYFKNYNDSLGHQTGDTCLQMIANALQLCMRRSTDFVARYGGEEFIVLLPGTNLEGVERVANNLLTTIRDLSIPHPNSPVSKKVSISMGASSIIPSMGCTYERLIRFADQALYQAKETGRNKFCSYKD